MNKHTIKVNYDEVIRNYGTLQKYEEALQEDARRNNYTRDVLNIHLENGLVIVFNDYCQCGCKKCRT